MTDLISSKSEKEFLRTRKEGGLVKIAISGSEPKWVVYEGRIDEKESFIERKENSTDIISIRSHIRYLQFGEDEIKHASHIDVNHLYYNIHVYNPTSPRYESAKDMLKKANKWQGVIKTETPIE